MDVIDSLVVTLGLDPRNYQREIKNYRDDRKRLAEEDAKYNRASEDAQKRATEGIRSLRNETVGFLFVLAGANGIKDFAANILTGDAATGRLAKNLGIATEQASAWEGAIKRVGGTAADIDGSLRAMSSAFQSLQLTGTTGHDADFQGLGVNARDLQNPSDALLKIAESSQRMSRPEFNARLSRIGFDQNTINLLAKGKQGVSELLEEQRKLGVVTDKDAEAAQRFQDRLAAIETAITGKARPAIEHLADVVGTWLTKGDNLNTVLTATEGILGAVALAAAAAYWPFALLAGAIALVATNLDKLKSAWNNFKSWWDNLKDKSDSVFDPVRKFFGLKSGAEARAAGTDIFGNSTGEGPSGSPAPGGSSAAASAGGGGADGIQRYWQARGFSAVAARGMVAAMHAENSSLSASTVNPKSGAYGIGQWLGPRKAALFAKYGRNPTLQQQLDFMYSEMRGGDPGATLGATDIARATSSGAAAKAMIDRFYRPGPGTQGDYNRASRFLGGSTVGVAARGAAVPNGPTSNTTSIGSITIYTAATDADGIAHDLRGSLAKRGLVVQANTGLAQ